MKGKWFVVALTVSLFALLALTTGCSTGQDGSSSASSGSAAAGADKTPDYSQKSSWYKIPEVTKDIDTFYIYSTVYFGKEGDPGYAALDNAEMLDGIKTEYTIKTSAFDESKNCNNGRPFVIAGHSQGSAILHLVLKDYFKKHPERDETYAPASENLGSLVMDAKTGATEIRDIGADAQVNLARGTVVTNANAVPNEMKDLAGPQNYHQDDYSIFFNNIKDNVAKRIAAYEASH